MNHAEESLRKAAVLVSALEEADAHALLTRLGAAPAARLRRAVATLGPVAVVERDNVIRAFLLSERSPHDNSAQGVEIHEDLARRLSTLETDDGQPTTDSSSDVAANAPFEFLLESESDVVAAFLARENPQTIAVVLSFLGRRQAAELLQRLEPALRNQVLKRLATLNEIDPTCIKVVAAELRAWLERQRSTGPRADGDRLIRDLLKTPHDQDRAQVIADLHRAATPTQSAAIPASARRESVDRSLQERNNVGFGELLHFPHDDLADLVRATPHEVLTLALAGADEGLVERVVQSLSRRDARRLRRGIGLQGPTRLADIEDAQRRVETIATKIIGEKASILGFVG